MTEYKARIEGKGDIRAVIVFFRDPNIIDAANSIKNIAHTLGFCEDDVKQIVELETKVPQPPPVCISSYNCKMGFHDRKCPLHTGK